MITQFAEAEKARLRGRENPKRKRAVSSNDSNQVSNLHSSSGIIFVRCFHL